MDLRFRTPIRKKTTPILTKLMSKVKIVQIFRSLSKGQTLVDQMIKLKKYDSLQRKILKKTPDELIDQLVSLLELLKEMYGSSNICLSILRNMKGFKSLSIYFIEPESKDFRINYTVKKFKEKKNFEEEYIRNISLIKNELKTFLKKKQMEMAEMKATFLQDNFQDLKKKTYDYLEKMKCNNVKKYRQEKEFLMESLDFINYNQISNRFNLKSLKELESSEKTVGKFDKIKDISRMIAKSMDIICKKTGF